MKNRTAPWSLVGGALLLLTGLLVAGALVACSGPTPAASSPTVTPSATVTGSSQASAEEFRGMLPVVFTQALVKERAPGTARKVGDVVEMRRIRWTYRNESSDPRLGGRLDIVINIDQRQDDMSASLWGTSRLSNAGGTWLGEWTGGIAAGGKVHHLSMMQKGRGGYAGLVSHSSGWFEEAGGGFTPEMRIVNAGWIETADGSPVPPAPGPGTTPADWTPVVGIATTRETDYDGAGAWLWDLEQSDPRLSGRLEGAVEEIGSPRADGSIDYLASHSLSNDGGSWDAPSGAVQVRGPGPRFEHFMYWTSTGSGAYEGLTYHGFWHFPEPRDIQPGDTFVYTGWIEATE